MNKSFLLPFVLFIYISGCSPFGGGRENIKPLAGGLSPKALYEIAEDKLNAGSVDQAIEQFELILASYPNSKYSIQARLDIAYNLFKRKKYNRAIISLEEFIKRYPFHQSTPYAYYLRGVIAEEKSSSLLDDLITDKAQRDVQSISNAYKYYEELISKFPDSKYSKDAEKKLVNLVNSLARHELYVAMYYTRIGANIAAINRSKYIIENYPTSQSIPDALHLMAYNYDLIKADNLAIDTRIVLSSNFPAYFPNYSINN
tara:strand:- start:66 stop:839 length:774 start_codon:yes stop_codon:yes gene_type:complete